MMRASASEVELPPSHHELSHAFSGLGIPHLKGRLGKLNRIFTTCRIQEQSLAVNFMPADTKASLLLLQDHRLHMAGGQHARVSDLRPEAIRAHC